MGFNRKQTKIDDKDKTVLEFNAKNIDFIYVCQHIIYADYLYKKSVLSNGGTTAENIEKYIKMTKNYLDKKLFNFTADIIQINIANNNIIFEIKVYPTYYYQVFLPVVKFDEEILFKTEKKEGKINPLNFGFEINDEIKIKKVEPKPSHWREKNEKKKTPEPAPSRDKKPKKFKPKRQY